MHFVCCFLLFLLSCFAALLISHVYRPSSRFLHIFLGFVVNPTLYRPSYIGAKVELATRRITNDHSHTPPITFGRLHPPQQPGLRG